MVHVVDERIDNVNDEACLAIEFHPGRRLLRHGADLRRASNRRMLKTCYRTPGRALSAAALGHRSTRPKAVGRHHRACVVRQARQR